ncbi:nucleotidyltransferase domain-containing protein [[Clostridium] innocuum]|nr:nucleotidyltransferase domain-containing protein [[Clostridium] innocuum]
MVYSISDLKNLIIPIIKKYKAENAILFGSHARNQATSDSDIDLIVIGGIHLIQPIFLRLQKIYMNNPVKK